MTVTMTAPKWSIDDGAILILLNLDGQDGVEISELSRSNIFMDSGGDGLLHRTAWAGAGDGVLFYDANGDGLISEKREYIFTEWDPTATSDLEALRAVFDSNGDGKLTAAEFANHHTPEQTMATGAAYPEGSAPMAIAQQAQKGNYEAEALLKTGS